MVELALVGLLGSLPLVEGLALGNLAIDLLAVGEFLELEEQGEVVQLVVVE